MTRQEQTNHRSLAFSKWIRANLPDSRTKFYVYDVDYVILDWARKKVMLLEEKTHGAGVRYPQNKVIKLIDSWMRNGVNNGWEYKGYYTIVFENTSPMDGRIWFDDVEVNEDVLIDILSLGRPRKENIKRMIVEELLKHEILAEPEVVDYILKHGGLRFVPEFVNRFKNSSYISFAQEASE